MLNVWGQWVESGYNDAWAREHFLNVRQLFEIQEIKSQLMRELRRKKIDADDTNGKDPEAIQKCVVAGLIQHLMVSGHRHSYRKVDEDANFSQDYFVHPASSCFSAQPKFMIGADVVKTSKTFARRCQPVVPEWLREIAPNLIEERKNYYFDEESGDVREQVEMFIKGNQNDFLGKLNRSVSNSLEAATFLAKQMSLGKVNLPSLNHNKEVLQRLQAFRNRSGGQLELPDMTDWYKKRIGNISSLSELQTIEKNLYLNFEEYCPKEVQEKVDLSYPEKIKVKDTFLDVAYQYFPANPSSWYVEDRVERFKATINLDAEKLFEFEENDFPIIGVAGRPKIIYTAYYSSYQFESENLTELKTKIDSSRRTKDWNRFEQPQFQEIKFETGMTLPSFDSLGAGPIKYSKDYKGNDIYAYPAVSDFSRYKGDITELYFKIVYCPNQEEADKKNYFSKEALRGAEESWSRDQARQTLLQPAKDKFNEIQEIVYRIKSDPTSFGFWDFQVDELIRDLQRAEYNINKASPDVVVALEVLGEIQARVQKDEGELERRNQLIPGVQARMELLAERMDNIDYNNYAQYGFTYDSFIALKNEWNEATRLISSDRRSSSRSLPDPEKALLIIKKIEQNIPEQFFFSPEQKALGDVMAGRNANFATIISVRNGKVVESARALSPNEIDENPKTISIGGSGRSLKVNGKKVVFILGSGNESGSWELADGDYFVSRDATVFLKVEKDVQAPYGMRALEVMSPSFNYEDFPPRSFSNDPTVPVYEEAVPSQTRSVFATLLEKLKSEPEEKPVLTKKEVIIKPINEPEKIEEMTEGFRTGFLAELNNARFFLDTVWAVPVPDKKNADANKISKVRNRVAELKRELNAMIRELQDSDNVARVRGKVQDLLRRSKRAAEEISKYQNVDENWTKKFDNYLIALEEMAKNQEIEINEESLNKIRAKIAELAQRKSEVFNLEEELELIILDSL